MLDVVKLIRPGRRDADSLASIDRFLLQTDTARLMEVDGASLKEVIDAYRDDDWDILISEEEQAVRNLMTKEYAAFSSFPIVRQQNTTGITIGGEYLDSPAHAFGEVADMMVATEVWMISQYMVGASLEHYSKYFQSHVIAELREKIRVRYLGVELGNMPIVDPVPIGKNGVLRIFFPHRVNKSKGLEEFLEYLKELKLAEPNLKIVVVSHTGRVNAWKELEGSFEVEQIGWLEREAYLHKAQTCDIVFSNPHHENFGLAVLEAIAMGCYPVLSNSRSYPELIPAQFLFDSTKQAVEMTLASIRKTFDNTFVKRFLWDAISTEWKRELKRVYEEFYGPPKVTEVGEKLIEALKVNPMTKREVMKYLGWSRLTGWGKYRQMIKTGVPVSQGPNVVYGEASGIESKVEAAHTRMLF